MTKVVTVAYINQYDQPDWERAKMQISTWLNTSERGVWLRQHYHRIAWNIEPDGGMEPHYIIEVEMELSDRDYTYYCVRWGTPVMVEGDVERELEYSNTQEVDTTAKDIVQ